MSHIERHPAERGSGPGIIFPACGCSCCCCCCCLHTLGALTGSVVASQIAYDPLPLTATSAAMERELAAAQDAADSQSQAVSVYWSIFLALSVLGAGPAIGLPLAQGSHLVESVIFAALLVAVGLPVVQLVAAVASAGLIIMNWPIPFPSTGAALRRVGLLALGTFLGTAAGLLIMGAVLLVFVGVR